MPRLIILLFLSFVFQNVKAQEVVWASRVVNYSSQYDNKNFSANQILGEPNGMPYQERSLVSWTPASRTNEASITVEFPKAVNVQQIGIGENLLAGAISKIVLIDAYGKENIVYNQAQTVQSQPKADAFFNYFIPLTNYKVSRLRLELRYADFKTLPQIDCIGISSDGKKIQPKINTLEYTDIVPRPENLGNRVNSQYHDMLPIISPDNQTLYFARKNAPENMGMEKKDDIYVSQKSPTGFWSKAYNIGAPLNTDEHNFVCAISPDGNTMYLANKYDYRTEGQGVAVSYRQKNGTWSKPKALDIINMYNKNKYVCYHLSIDEKVLVMAIERDDTYGDMDLYVSFRYADGTWTEPMNMGPDLNTAGAEASIFLAADGKTIYFSSNGYNGYGDLDMYMSKRLDNTWKNWSTPVNLGPNINTIGMDIYYTIPASGEYAYYSSDRGGYGLNDIFRIKLPKQLRPDEVKIDPALYSSYTVEIPALKPYQQYETSAVDKRIEELKKQLDGNKTTDNQSLQDLDKRKKQIDSDIKNLESQYSRLNHHPQNYSQRPLPTFDRASVPQYDASYDSKINDLKRQLMQVESSQPILRVEKEESEPTDSSIKTTGIPTASYDKALSVYEEKLKKLQEENDKKKSQNQTNIEPSQTVASEITQSTNPNSTQPTFSQTSSPIVTKKSDSQLTALEEKLKKLEEANQQKRVGKEEPKVAKTIEKIQEPVADNDNLKLDSNDEVVLSENGLVANISEQPIALGTQTIDTVSRKEFLEWEQKRNALLDSINALETHKNALAQQASDFVENKENIQKENQNLLSEQEQLALNIEQMKMEKEQLALEKEKIENERKKLDLLKNQQYKDINKLKRELDSLENIKAKSLTQNQAMTQQVQTSDLQKSIDNLLNDMKKEVGEKVVLNNVYFVVNASFIQARSHADLDRLALYLIKNKEINIEIGGHTNGLCDDAFCDELSKKRAVAVKDYLVTKGVSADRLSAKGYGKTQNIASNNTAEGRNQNQRVEILITKVN
ncbi:MAG: OmpA family protein [Chitinophagales bacterium]|nr:OmpA family protein [Chitinophagales bacterium]